ncbi:hypothetical protein ACFU99_32405 [Streptomyces sp. NPDC057654]|uniref:hypothetical protein n=1 Tax=Streptomyces sp. NPDC057654 TaxID=3346196 RepID=UPI0036CC7038
MSTYLSGGVRPEPRYTLAYTLDSGPVAKAGLRAAAVEKVGAVLARAAGRGEAWDIAVRDFAGADVTDAFACFND